MCRLLVPTPCAPTHYDQGSHGIGERIDLVNAANYPRVLIRDPIRQHPDGLCLEERVSSVDHQPPHQHCLSESNKQEDFHQIISHPRAEEHSSRLVVPKRRPQKLPFRSRNLQGGVPTFPLQPRCGFVCESGQSTDAEFFYWRIDPKSLGSAFQIHWRSINGWANPLGR